MVADDHGVEVLEKNIKAKDGVKWAYTLACFRSLSEAVNRVESSVKSIQRAAWIMAISCLGFLASLLIAGAFNNLVK